MALVSQRQAAEEGSAAPSREEPTSPTVSDAPVVDASPSGSPRPTAPPSATATDCRSLDEDVSLRVLTLNVHGGQGPGGFDMGRLTDFLRRADVDVALLQEVDRARPRSRYVDMPAVLASGTGMEVAYGLNVRLGPRRGVSGIATLSRHPIVEQLLTHLPRRPGLKQRGVLRTDLDVDGLTVSVFNTHLEHARPTMRNRQLAAVRGPVAATPHPVVLGGDLNAYPGSGTLGIARAFLRDAWSAGTGTGATSPASGPRNRIDYLLYAPPVRVRQAQVMPQVVSDHLAVRAEFVLPADSPEICVPVLDGAMGEDGTGN
jgi:endonuclease/exonuclease/phosphatase family metal-dependent hydrolase